MLYTVANRRWLGSTTPAVLEIYIEFQVFVFADGRLIACHDPRRIHHCQTYSGIIRKDHAMLNYRKKQVRLCDLPRVKSELMCVI